MKDYNEFTIVGSTSGGLHESSKGETYPWTPQPRIRKYADMWDWETGDLPEGDDDYCVVWVAFNALTGVELGAWKEAHWAAEVCREMTVRGV